jgi:hypothetical protein
MIHNADAEGVGVVRVANDVEAQRSLIGRPSRFDFDWFVSACHQRQQ